MKYKPKKLAIAIILSLQSYCFIGNCIPTSIGSRLAEDHYAVLTEAHNRVYKRDFVDWSKEIWGDPLPAKKGEMLREGMQVGTANKSWAEISWPNVTTRAWENSVVAISPGKRLVYLLNGEMLFQLDKNRKDKSDTVIWTRVLQLRLHGTSVLVQAMTDFTRVAVLEGEIDVTNRYDNSVISLKPGAVYELRTGAAPAGPPPNVGSSFPSNGLENNRGGNPVRPAQSGAASSFGSGSSTQNYANQMNSSDWQAFKEMKERMPGIPEPQNWGPNDYQKFQDMKSKWSYMKQQLEEKQKKEEEYKQQYWQNKQNQSSPQDWQKLQKMKELKEQWEQEKHNKGLAPDSAMINIATIDGEPDIYPPSWRNSNFFDNLLANNAQGAFSRVGYGSEYPQGQWQQKQKENCQQWQGGNQQCNPEHWQKDRDCTQSGNPQCKMPQQWQPQQQWKQNTQGFNSGANKSWNQQNSTLQTAPSLFMQAPIASRWDTQELAPTGNRPPQTVKNTDSSFVAEIVSWNAQPINIFRTEKSATNIYLADTDAILKHPLLSSSFPSKIASATLIQSSLARYRAASRGTAGDPKQVRNQILDESVAVVQAPTVAGYLTGKEIGPGNSMPGSRKLGASINQ